MAKVFLNSGHGGTDAGASYFGMNEKDINLQIMLACKNELERHKVEVVTSKTKDEDDKLADVVREANKSKSDIAVSFHTNASTYHNGDGSETFYYGTSAKGKKLAELCEKYVKELGQNSRGVKNGKGLYFINATNMPAVLCECAFLDNDKDNDIIDTAAEQKKFGVAYAKAILEYFGIKYIAPATKPATTTSKLYRVQVGSFKDKANAEKLKKELANKGFNGLIVEV